MWLQRWSHPKIWNQQDGDPAKPACSSSLSLKAWEPGQPMAWVPIRWPEGSRIKKSPCFILSPKVGKDWCSSSKQPGGTRRIPSCSACLFYSGLQLIGWGPHSLGRVICFIQSTYSAVYLTRKHPHRHPTRVFDPVPWHPVAQAKQHQKFTIAYVAFLLDLKWCVASSTIFAGPSQDDVKGSCYVPHSILFIPCPDLWVPPPLA